MSILGQDGVPRTLSVMVQMQSPEATMTLDGLIAALGDRQPTEAEQAEIYKLMSPEQILIINGVMIGKPARKQRK